MKTKTVTLYKFDELSPKLKEKVLDKYRAINVKGSYWYDYDGKTGFNAQEIKEYELERFSECDALEYDYKKMTFDIEYTPHVQFRGCTWSNDALARQWLGVSQETWDKGAFQFIHPRDESKNTTIEFWVYMDDEFTDEDEKQIERAISRFDSKMDEAARDLQAEYNNLQLDESIADTLRINDYYFNESGEMDD